MRSTLKQFGDQFAVGSLALTLNVPIVSLVLWYNLRKLPLDVDAFAYLAATILGYYHLPLLVLMSVLCLVFAARPRLLHVIVGLLLTTYVAYILLDALAFRVTKLHIDLFWLEYALRDFAGFGLPAVVVPVAILVLIFVLAAERRVVYVACRLARRRHMNPAIVAIAAVALVSSQARHVVAYERNDEKITALTPCLPFYAPLTSHRNAEEIARMLPPAIRGNSLGAPNGVASALKFPAGPLEFTPAAETPPLNVVVILLECWRYDMLDPSVTPNIAAFAERAVVFTNHLSAGNSTTAGLFGLMYGIHPTYWPAVKAHSNVVGNPPLINRLRDLGYAFGVFADSNFERHKVKDTVFRGIDIQETFAGASDDERDGSMTNLAVDFLDTQITAARPYLLFAFYKASHTGYSYPPDQARFRPSRRLNVALADRDEAELYKNDYRNALHWDDQLVGTILRLLERRGQLDHTIVIITSDHGESFDDNHNDDWGHGSNFTKYQVQVPLICYAPDRDPQRRTERTAHVDVSPTLLRDYFGCLNPISDFSNGVDMFAPVPETRGFVVGSYVNHGFVIDDDVFAVYPMYTRKYKFDDVRAQATAPQAGALRKLGQGMGCFYAESRLDGRST